MNPNKPEILTEFNISDNLLVAILTLIHFLQHHKSMKNFTGDWPIPIAEMQVNSSELIQGY
jgi:hypothetical protein